MTLYPHDIAILTELREDAPRVTLATIGCVTGGSANQRAAKATVSLRRLERLGLVERHCVRRASRRGR